MKTKVLAEEVETAANEIYRELGSGRDEKIYEEAFAVEFRLNNIPYRRQDRVEVFYKGYKVGDAIADFIIDDHVVVELKGAASISNSHRAQCLAYMRSLEKPDGIIVNFPYPTKKEVSGEILSLHDEE